MLQSDCLRCIYEYHQPIRANQSGVLTASSEGDMTASDDPDNQMWLDNWQGDNDIQIVNPHLNIHISNMKIINDEQ